MPHYGERLRGETALREMEKHGVSVGDVIQCSGAGVPAGMESAWFRVTAVNEATKEVTLSTPFRDRECSEHWYDPVTIRHHGNGNAHHSGKSRT